jgi:arylformamidase
VGADPTAHEREYSPSSCIPSIDVELLRYEQDSAAAASLPHRSLPYGELEHERLIVFDGPAHAPLHVFIHGGYWQALSATHSLMPAPEFVAAGRCFAAVDYALAPTATIGTMIDQCVLAIERIVADLRPSALTLSGSSAGAHLAAHVAQRADVTIDRLILLSGMFQLEPLRATTVNEALGLDAAAAAAWSVPLSPRPTCQVVIVHGRNETVAFKAQSARLAAAWGVPAVEVADRNHFDLVHDLAAIDLRLGPPGRDAAAGSANDDEVALVAAAERPGAPRRLALELLHPTAM